MRQLQSLFSSSAHPVVRLEEVILSRPQLSNNKSEIFGHHVCPAFRLSYRLSLKSSVSPPLSLGSYPITKWLTWLMLEWSSVLTPELSEILTDKALTLASPSPPSASLVVLDCCSALNLPDLPLHPRKSIFHKPDQTKSLSVFSIQRIKMNLEVNKTIDYSF